MRGIKVGNILMFRKFVVCIVCEVIREDRHVLIIGRDSNNTIHEGTPDKWESILHKKMELKLFEDNILNNIISSRQFGQ